MAKRVAEPKLTLSTARTKGERFKAARLRAGLNKSQATRAIGVTFPTLETWERDDETNPTLGMPDSRNLAAAAQVYNVSEAYLLGHEEPDVLECAEFREWLETPEGRSVTTDERATLGAWSFPPGAHPGVRFYSDALRIWRDLLELRLAKRAAEEMASLRKSHAETLEAEENDGDSRPQYARK